MTHRIDLVLFAVYIVLNIALGIWVGRRQVAGTRGYFLAGDGLPWYAIGGSIIAANISTEHFIGMIGVAYAVGFVVAQWEWGNWFTFSALIWIFLPYYIRGGLYTMPEFLERRYNSTCRYLFAICSLVLWIVAQMAVVMFAGGKAMEGMFGLGPDGHDCGPGGAGRQLHDLRRPDLGGLDRLPAIRRDDARRADCDHRGSVPGWRTARADARRTGEVQDHLPAHGQGVSLVRRVEFVSVDWHLVQLHEPVHRAAMPGCAERVGCPHGCGLCGLHEDPVAAAGRHSGNRGVSALSRPADKDQAFPNLVRDLVPIGLSGIVMAGLASGMLSHVSSVLNSCSTIFTMDLYKPVFGRRKSEQHLVLVGRISAFVILLTATALAIWFSRHKWGVFDLIQDIGAWVAAPISAVFLLGVLWRRTTAWARHVRAGVCLSVHRLPRVLPVSIRLVDRTLRQLAQSHVSGVGRLDDSAGVVVAGDSRPGSGKDSRASSGRGRWRNCPSRSASETGAGAICFSGGASSWAPWPHCTLT